MYMLGVTKDQWSVDIETITPDAAKDILDKSNRGNRKLRPAVVEKYAKMMRIGDWRLSPEAIVISNTGRLLNGQHRLSAVVKSGVTVRFLTIRGPSDDVFSVLDRGTIRTTADALGADKRTTEIARLIVMIAQIDNRVSINDPDVARALPLISDVHHDLMNFCGSCAPSFSSAPFRLAAVARVLGGGDREYIFKLYRDLVLTNVDALPPIGKSAIKAHMQGRIKIGGGAVQFENLGYAWGLFDIYRRDNERAAHPKSREYIGKVLEAVGYVKS